MRKEYIVCTRDGRYLAGLVGKPERVKLVADIAEAQVYPNRWAALEACNRAGAVLHMASIVPYRPQDAPEAPEGTATPKKRDDAPERL